MKRELKLDSPATYRGPPYEYCRAYPDEKGIETDFRSKYGFLAAVQIAEPIPMKRELKLHQAVQVLIHFINCRAYPDEKGIETWGRAYMVMYYDKILQSLSR